LRLAPILAFMQMTNLSLFTTLHHIGERSKIILEEMLRLSF
jgi:hypothetical protein